MTTEDMSTAYGAGATAAGAMPAAPGAVYPEDAGAPRTGENVADRSVGELVGEIARDMSTLVRQEIELAKVETKQEATKAAKGAGMLGGAGFAGYMVALFVSLTVAALLDLAMPTWVALLIVAVIWGVVGAVLYSRGRSQLKTVNPPRNTVETVKEDAAWARHPTS